MATTTKTENGFALQDSKTGLFFDTGTECYLTGSPESCNIFDTIADAAEASTWEGFDLDLETLRPVPIERTVTANVGEPAAWPMELLAEYGEGVDDDGEGDEL